MGPVTPYLGIVQKLLSVAPMLGNILPGVNLQGLPRNATVSDMIYMMYDQDADGFRRNIHEMIDWLHEIDTALYEDYHYAFPVLDDVPKPKRKRRTKAEMEAANAEVVSVTKWEIAVTPDAAHTYLATGNPYDLIDTLGGGTDEASRDEHPGGTAGVDPGSDTDGQEHASEQADRAETSD